jgi:hypothetical protein
MNANFHVAIYAFSSAVVVGWLASSRRSDELSPSAARLVFHWRSAFHEDANRLLWILSAILLSGCLVLNWIWR